MTPARLGLACILAASAGRAAPAPVTVTVKAPSFLEAKAAWRRPGQQCRLLPRAHLGMTLERRTHSFLLAPTPGAGFAVHCEGRLSATRLIGPLSAGRYQLVWQGKGAFGANRWAIESEAKGDRIKVAHAAPVVFAVESKGAAVCGPGARLRANTDLENGRLVLTTPACGGVITQKINIGKGAYQIVVKGGALTGAWVLGEMSNATLKP